MSAHIQPVIQPFFESLTHTWSYVVHCPASRRAAIYDCVLNYDFASGGTAHHSADEIITYVQAQNLSVDWIIETHAHADHLTAAPYLQEKLSGKIAIGHRIHQVQSVFIGIFNLADSVAADGRQFDHLFADGEHYQIGELDAYTIPTPGHTPACMSHVIGDAVLVGDTIFRLSVILSESVIFSRYGVSGRDLPEGFPVCQYTEKQYCSDSVKT